MYDAMLDSFYWTGNDPFSGHSGGDMFPSLDTPEKTRKKRRDSVF